jgi:hypothetical protein
LLLVSTNVDSLFSFFEEARPDMARFCLLTENVDWVELADPDTSPRRRVSLQKSNATLNNSRIVCPAFLAFSRAALCLPFMRLMIPSKLAQDGTVLQVGPCEETLAFDRQRLDVSRSTLLLRVGLKDLGLLLFDR